MNTDKMKSFFSKKRVMVTGAAGTIGLALIEKLTDFPVSEIRVIDNNESDLFFIDEKYKNDKRVQVYIGDMRDKEKLNEKLHGIHIVFHAAAFKHVSLCERSPFDAVQTNILGTQNLIKAACGNGVEKVLFMSSDKAVNPTNVMGTSKLFGERMITAAHADRHKDGPIFLSTRFGNVAGSRGSVVPLFIQQIEKGGPVTVTHKDMTRFFMTTAEAVDLIIKSMVLSCGGEVFITKMEVMNILDIAKISIQLLSPLFGHAPKDIKISMIGPKPGEKLYEELMSEEETRRAFELEDFFVVLPAFRNMYHDVKYIYPGHKMRQVTRAYNSSNEPPLKGNEIKKFFLQEDVLPRFLKDKLGGYR